MSLSDDAARELLAAQWDLPGPRVTAHHGGMNSATWFVTSGDTRAVLKVVPAAAGADLGGGVAVAAHLDRAGIPAGGPLPARDGRTVVPTRGYAATLLTWVPGEPLDAVDQRTIGGTLARVHRALDGFAYARSGVFPGIDPDAPHLDVRPWVRPAVRAVLAATDLAGLTEGWLHGDPAPEAFRRGERIGMIDWSWAIRGPLLYDLASAAMYVGGAAHASDLIAAYLTDGPLTAAEVRSGLPMLARYRFAIQADYFARRIATRDLTGIPDDQGNLDGLEHARAALGVRDAP